MILDPLFECVKAGGFDAASAHAAELFSVREPYLFEDLQVLGHGRERDSERLGETRDGRGPGSQPIEYRAARGIAERVKQAIDIDACVCHGGASVCLLRKVLAEAFE